MHVNFPSGPPARLRFLKISSSNDKPATLRRFIPFSCSHAVLPSRPTSNLVNRNLACLASHGHTECVTYIFTSHFSSIALRIVLLTPCTDNRTVLDDHPRSTPRRSQRAPSLDHTRQRRLSDFTMSTNSSPISRSCAASLRHVHSRGLPRIRASHSSRRSFPAHQKNSVVC